MRWRVPLGAAGVLFMAYGGFVVFTNAHIRDPRDVAVWLAGAIVVHDGLIAPLVLALGALLAVLVRRPGTRWVVRGGLAVAGSLTAVALPVLLSPGNPGNATVLPLDYLANWLLLLAATAAVTALVLVLRATLPRPYGRRARRRR